MLSALLVVPWLVTAPLAHGQELPTSDDLGRIGPRKRDPQPAPPPVPEQAPPPKEPKAEPEPAPVVADPYALVRGPHGADRALRLRRAAPWDTWGHIRARVVGSTDPVLDVAGTTTGASLWGTSRIIAGADWRPTDVTTVALEIEALNGRLFGDTTSVGTAYDPDVFDVRRADTRDLNTFLPRRLSATFNAGRIGIFTIGAQPFAWGLGIFANDGQGDPDFGDPNRGDVVLRVGYTATPWTERDDGPLLHGLTLFAAGDLAIRDDRASLFEGDLAASGLVGVRYLHRRLDAGLLGVARWQQDRPDPRLPDTPGAQSLTFPVDAYATVLLTRDASPHRVVAQAEVAAVQGTTHRPYAHGYRSNGMGVRQVGALFQLRYDHDASQFTAKLTAGYASGDQDTRDASARTFAMHSDHNVGLILFDQLLPLLAARAIDRTVDPDLGVTQPSPGRFGVPQGGVQNTVYLNPVLRWRPWAGLDLRAGYLAAWSSTDFIDTYETVARNKNTTPGGASPGTRALGHEVDLAARYLIRLPRRLSLEIGADGGVFLPGSALDGLGGTTLSTQWLGRVRADFRW